MIAKKVFFSSLFVTMLVVPLILGAVPLAVDTPIGSVRFDMQEAEARNHNTNANRPRSVSVRNSGARLHQSFSATRTSYRVEVRQSTTRANIRVGLREGQQHRWRIDRRNSSGNWVNGRYNSWRARATSNINRDVRVNVNQGQERRLRLQIRDRNNNIRTLTFNVQRASGNTWGANLRANAGIFNRGFNRSITSYTLTVPITRYARTEVSIRPAQERAMSSSRMRIQDANGTWGAWSSWSSFSRGQTIRSVGTIPRGRSAEMQFRIRGAWTNRSNTTLRMRTYTVTINRTGRFFSDYISAIRLPSRQLTSQERADWIAEYNHMGGASAFELEVIRLINEERRSRGLNTLSIDTRLMHASRFHAQGLANLLPQGGGGGVSLRATPYGNALGVAVAFGTSASAGHGHWTPHINNPQRLVHVWMSDPNYWLRPSPHFHSSSLRLTDFPCFWYSNILRADLTHIGMGSQRGYNNGRLVHQVLFR